MIAIIDYGVGNLVQSGFQPEKPGAGNQSDPRRCRHPRGGPHHSARCGRVCRCHGQAGSHRPGAVIKQEVEHKPLLGICLGMQLLFEKSYEYGEHTGLGLIPGEVCPLADDLKDPSLKVPHIGWNRLDIVPGRENDPLFKYTKPGEYVYYVHSFYAKNCAANTLAASEYSIPVTGAVKNGLVYGTQFHPEKSGDTGLRMLRAFAEL